MRALLVPAPDSDAYIGVSELQQSLHPRCE